METPIPLAANLLGFVESTPPRIGSHPRIRNDFIDIQLQRYGDEIGYIPRNDTGPHGVETPTPMVDS